MKNLIHTSLLRTKNARLNLYENENRFICLVEWKSGKQEHLFTEKKELKAIRRYHDMLQSIDN